MKMQICLVLISNLRLLTRETIETAWQLMLELAPMRFVMTNATLEAQPEILSIQPNSIGLALS